MEAFNIDQQLKADATSFGESFHQWCKLDALSFEPIFINFPHWGELGERAVLRPPRCAEFSAYIDRSNSGHIEAHA